MIDISLVVITLNEEKNIGKCLESVSFAHEVLVIDSGSTDNTKKVSEALGARFISHHWEGYGKQKQFAIEQATNDWVLLLDADEFLTKELVEEIKEFDFDDIQAMELPIKQIFLGQVCHYGKAVSYPVRMFNRKHGAYDLKNIHEAFIVNGRVSRFKSAILHNSATDIGSRIKKIKRDVHLEIKNSTLKVKWHHIFIDPVRYFFSYYLKQSAWRDGVPGFILTFLFAVQILFQNLAIYARDNLNFKFRS